MQLARRDILGCHELYSQQGAIVVHPFYTALPAGLTWDGELIKTVAFTAGQPRVTQDALPNIIIMLTQAVILYPMCKPLYMDIVHVTIILKKTILAV